MVGQPDVAVGGETDDHAAGILVGLELADQVDDLRDRDAGRRAGRGLPGRGGHAGGATLRDQHAVRAEAGRRADHRAEVARVGHRVERDDERPGAGRRGEAEEVVRVGVLVGRDPGGQALVDGTSGHPVELGSGHLEQGDPGLGGEREGVTETAVALGALGDVHAVDRYPGAQHLDHGVASCHPLGVRPLRGRRRGFFASSRSARAACLCALWYGRSLALGVGPLPSSPRRTCPPEPTAGFLLVLRIAPLR